mmetsp:Transcript_6709/g.7704  ORF Transcript_6709/g.7704 Transcript_6709/m.7704 type:complete len:271 (-) Transcript_6709:440-1252(-)
MKRISISFAVLLLKPPGCDTLKNGPFELFTISVSPMVINLNNFLFFIDRFAQANISRLPKTSRSSKLSYNNTPTVYSSGNSAGWHLLISSSNPLILDTKGSGEASVAATYSANSVTFFPTLGDTSCEMKLTVRSIPAATPLLVKNFPSSTHRASSTQFTSGNLSCISHISILFVVARLPFKLPSVARTPAPLQTEITTLASSIALESQLTLSSRSISASHPFPPGIKSISSFGMELSPGAKSETTFGPISVTPFSPIMCMSNSFLPVTDL